MCSSGVLFNLSSNSCTLLWKAIGIVLTLYALYYGFKMIRWAFTDAPTGLEGMPEFSTSLGCSDAPYIYNNSQVTIDVPVGTRRHDSAFDIRGHGVGTITEDLLKDVAFVNSDIRDDGVVTRSRLIIETSRIPGVDSKQCMRFDVKVYLPPNLKTMHVASHSVAHLQFAPGTRANLDELFVTLYAQENQNNYLSPKLHLEVYRGWIVGDASIVGETNIATQRGDGVANVKISPAAPADPSNPEKAILRTSTGAGRSDFTYLGSKAFRRNIEATHTSSRNADMYLTYRNADFNGKIAMVSGSYTMTGAQSFKNPVAGNGDDTTPKWTHFVGNQDGGDVIRVNTRGWTGLYF
ncbi:hypothetical protein BDZ97DRAFT_1787742 [Flammula alnicola]|nr:hypothetical protein BDZ97DRAFT_1787742 [Flammula alnicola]